MNEKIRPTIGTWHEFNLLAIRNEDGDKRQWIGKRCSPITGMFIGYRFKQNGEIKFSEFVPDSEYTTEESAYNYFQCESITEVWLFVTDPRYNPIEVMPSGVLTIRQ